MNKLYIFILSVLAPLGVFAQEKVCLSLEDCREMALMNDPYIRNSHLDILAAKAQKQEVLAEYFPSLRLQGFGFRALQPMIKINAVDILGDNETGQFVQDVFVKLSQKNGTEPYFSTLEYGYGANLTLTQPLYAGGRIVNGNRLARLGIEASKLKREITLRTKKEEIGKAYWEIVALEQKRSTLNSLDSLLRELEKDVESGLDAGVLTNTDLLQIKMKKNELKTGSIQLDGGMKLLKMNLFNAIGQPYHLLRTSSGSDAPFLDDITLTDKPDSLLPPDNYYISEEEIAAGVPERRLLELMVDSKKLEKKMALGEVLPSIGLGASYGYSYTLNGRVNGTVFGIASIPITDWGKASRKLERLEYQVEKAQNESRYLRSQLLLQAHQLWLDLNVAWEKMQVAQENVVLAEAAVRDLMARFHAGMTTLSEVLSAQAKLSEASEGLVDSRIEYSKALTEYTGRK